MAIDMSTENSSLVTSPRISFSHDLCQTDDAERSEDKRCRRDSSLLDSGSDEFDFCISSSIEADTSSAEELFSNGLIRTVQLQEKLVASKYLAISKPRGQAPLPPLPTDGISKQETWKETVSAITDQPEQKNQPKSFWRIKRSSSLHCDNKKSSFWSLPLLSRSNSTGSVLNSKQNTKENHKPNTNSKQQKNPTGVSASTSSTAFYMYSLSQKPPLRKNYLGPNANGLRISPVLNVPPPHISKGTANLLGLGSFFRNGKEKKIKK